MSRRPAGRSHAARPAPRSSQRDRPRRDVDLTRVLVAVVLVSGAVVLAYLFVVWRLAEQGLDVRGLVDVRLGPREWGYLTGFVVGAAGLLALLKRNGRIERLLGRDIPAQVSESMAADRDDVATRAATRAAEQAATAAAAAALAEQARLDQRTLQDVARVLAAAMVEVFERVDLAGPHADLVEQLIDVLDRVPAAPLPPLPPMPDALLYRDVHPAQHRQPTSAHPIAQPPPEPP